MSTPADLGASASLTILQKLAKGITMGKLSLFMLTIIPFTGVLGMNHAAMGNSSFALLKSSSFLVSGGLISLMIPYYPWFLRIPIAWFSMFGTWYIFDLLEFIDKETFEREGFRLPFKMELPGLATSERNKKGTWILKTPIALSIAAAFATSGVVLANYIPANILPASMASYITMISGGLGLALGIGAVVLAVTSAGPVGAVGAAALPGLNSSALAAVMAGGGSSLPSLSQFADKLLKSKSPDESYAFFSVIALIVFGGVATAWSKYPRT